MFRKIRGLGILRIELEKFRDFKNLGIFGMFSINLNEIKDL
jgi:hypothetical protein